MNQNHTAKISVLMPVYNGAKYLPSSIESVLKQTFTDFEFLIMDDGSTDESAAIIRKYAEKDARIKLFQQKNQGIVKSLNTLLENSESDIIARIDNDDLCRPERFEIQYRHLSEHADVVLVGSITNVFHEKTGVSKPNVNFEPDFMNRWFLCLSTPFTHSGVMFRKKAALEAGGYRASEYPAEDYGLWIRLKRFGHITSLQKTLLDYRLNPVGISGNNYFHQIDVRDKLQLENLEDLYRHDEIPSTAAIKKYLETARPPRNVTLMLGKIACLTGCFLIKKNDYPRAKEFFRLSLKLDRRRIDSVLNFGLGLLGKAFLISIDTYPEIQKKRTKIHFFTSEKKHENSPHRPIL